MTPQTAIAETIPTTLTEETLMQGARHLTQRDADLSCIYERLGAPPMWERAEGFPTLVHIILEQQVSLASARAAFERLTAAASPLTPQEFLKFDDGELKRIGFSRQKTGYVRHLAQAVIGGDLDIEALPRMNDDAVRAELTKIKGIGAWTSDIYLLMALRRPDVWPAGDLALAVALREVKGLPTRPTPLELEQFAEGWRPWRAVAARLLWHHYLNRPALGRNPKR